ncbi:MAG: hypothetical protein Q9183_001602 [Haloplaca sp. 2 TL-2023]
MFSFFRFAAAAAGSLLFSCGEFVVKQQRAYDAQCIPQTHGTPELPIAKSLDDQNESSDLNVEVSICSSQAAEPPIDFVEASARSPEKDDSASHRDSDSGHGNANFDIECALLRDIDYSVDTCGENIASAPKTIETSHTPPAKQTNGPETDAEAQDSSSDCIDGCPGANSDASTRLQEPSKGFVEALTTVESHSADDCSEVVEGEENSQCNEDAERETEQPAKIDQDELRSPEDLVTATGPATEETEQTDASIPPQEDTPLVRTVVDEPPTQPLLPAIPASLKPGSTQQGKPEASPEPPSTKADNTGSDLLDALFKKYHGEFNAAVPKRAPRRRIAASPPVNAKDILLSSLTLRLGSHNPPTSTMAKPLPSLTPHQAAEKTSSLPPKHEDVRTDTKRAKLDAILDMLKATSTARGKASDDQNAGIRQDDDAWTSSGPSSESAAASETKQPTSKVECGPQGAPDTATPSSPSTDPSRPLIDYESTTVEKGNGKDEEDRPQSPWLEPFPNLGLQAPLIPTTRTGAPLSGSQSNFVPVQRRDKNRSLIAPAALDETPMDIDDDAMGVEEDTMDIDAEEAMNGRCLEDEVIMAPEVPDVEMSLVLYEPEVSAACMAISQEIEMSDAEDSFGLTSDADDAEMSDADEDSDTDMSSVIDDEDQLNGDDAMDCDCAPMTIAAPQISTSAQGGALLVGPKAGSAKTRAKRRALIKLQRRQERHRKFLATLENRGRGFPPILMRRLAVRQGRVSKRQQSREERRRRLARHHWLQIEQMAPRVIAPPQRSSAPIGTPAEPRSGHCGSHDPVVADKKRRRPGQMDQMAASRKGLGSAEGPRAKDSSKRRQDKLDVEGYRKSR